jgi:hypothetical protein
MSEHMGGEEYELRIVALRGDAPPIVRLRHVRKALLRAYNFRATSCRDVTPPLPTPTASPGKRSPPEAGPESDDDLNLF